ncbi:MAG: hypothetical protein LC800_23295, partial [Acidobacteria bacterium]|nr:hypothetical protein [Acidobacteriota bacterium]
MAARRVFFPLVLSALCALSASSQQPDKAAKGPDKAATEQAGERAKAHIDARQKEAEAELRRKLVSHLDTLAPSAVALESPAERVRVLLEIADALWTLDSERARSSFTRAFHEVAKVAPESGADRARLAEQTRLRREVLARAARRDSALAAGLLRDAPSQPPTPQQKWGEMFGVDSPYNETLIGLAKSLLASDPKRSVELASLTLKDGVSQGLRGYLIELRARDQIAANALVESALRQATARRPAKLLDVLLLWEYAFQPSNFYFGRVSWS